MSLASFSIKNKLIGCIIILASLAWGTVAYLNMPRFEDPEFLIRTAQIYTEYPGASPQEVTDEVADPIETEIQGMQEVLEIRSTAYFGFSVIEVDIKHQFSPGQKDLQIVWTRLRSKVANAEPLLPPGAGKPFVNDDFGDVFGLYYLITGEGFTIKELDDYAQDLRKDILTVDGVAKVQTQGEQPEVITVELQRSRVAALGLSIDEVFSNISRQSQAAASGTVEVGDFRLVIQPTGQIDSLEAIKQLTIVAPQSGDLIPLGDIATIKREVAEPTLLRTRYDGQPAIALGISNVSGANVGAIGENVRLKMDEALAKRPNGMMVHEFYHQGDAVNTSIASFAISVVIALVIVLVTLFIFMGLRSALIIGAVLTITIAATLATMSVVGIPMHRISLGALIIALGMLVDNAIVVTDGILVGVRSGQPVLKSARKIVANTKWPLLGGTIVGILAFAPIGFAPGDTAEYTNHLFWVILISLSFSWIFALTLVPMLADLIFPKSTGSEEAVRPDGKIIRTYKSFLRAVLKLRWAVIAGTFVLFMVAGYGFGSVKEGFFPTSTTAQIAVDYWLPEGTDIDATTRDVELIEQELLTYEGITGLHSIVGASALRYMLIYAPEMNNSAFGQLILKVDDIDKIDALMPEIQSYLDKNYPQAQARVWRFILGPSQGSKIVASFSGPDPKVLRQLATEAKTIMIENRNASAVKTDWRQEIPVVTPQYDATRGARLGVTRGDLAMAMNRNFSGQTIGIYRDGEDLIPIINRAPLMDRNDLTHTNDIRIPSRLTGEAVPLSEVITGVDLVWQDGLMLREDRVWTHKVQSDPAPGVLASAVLAEIQPLVEAIELQPGYSLEWEGEYGDSQKANAELAQTLPLGLIAMVLVVVLLFNAIRQAIVIWLIVPLAIIGVVFGLLVTNTPLEFMAILGLLSLSGLLIKNAIVLIDQMDMEIRDGKPRLDAVIDSAASRMRPVMMGSLTTVFGVIPLLGDVFFASMAVVIIFGLTFATMLTLVVLPAIYVTIFKIKSTETLAMPNATAAGA